MADTSPESAYDRVTRYLLQVTRILSAISMFLMMALTFLDVIGRYFMRPIFGAPEMIQFLLAFTIFAAMGQASAHGDHIVVDIFVGRLKRGFGRAYWVFLRVVQLLGFSMIAWQLAKLAITAFTRSRVTIVLEWPMFWVLGPVAVLAVIALWVELAGMFVKGDKAHQEHSSW